MADVPLCRGRDAGQGKHIFFKNLILSSLYNFFNQGTCFGDSGGPFVVQKSEDDRFIQVVNCSFFGKILLISVGPWLAWCRLAHLFAPPKTLTLSQSRSLTSYRTSYTHMSMTDNSVTNDIVSSVMCI